MSFNIKKQFGIFFLFFLFRFLALYIAGHLYFLLSSQKLKADSLLIESIKAC